MLSDVERLDRLRLIRSENVGPATFRLLLKRFRSASEALTHLPELSRRAGGRKVKICPRARAEIEMEKLGALGGEWVMIGDGAYPETLGALDHAPPVLAVLGHAHLLQSHCIAIVGTRNASAAALAITKDIAGNVENHIIVSGLALGIDTAAHQASLRQGTIAVLAGGVDVVYPPQNQRLYEQICDMGCIISEMPLGEQPRAQHFPRRNRIISGLSLATVIIEAPVRSGAMITARTAAEQGRLVCAVPGSPIDPRARGANRLLRDGATLVENSEDILREIAPLVQRGLAEPQRPFTPIPSDAPQAEMSDYDALVALLGPTAVPLDDVIRLSGKPASLVNVILTDLEIAGRVHRDFGNRISLTPS